MDFKKYWSEKNSSGQRNIDLSLKAKEHSLLINGNNILDIGCGAGELLQELLHSGIPITDAIDYSESMIENAKAVIKESSINIEAADTFSYLKSATNDTWICTQSINQYLNEKDIKNTLLLFKENKTAKEFILFDTIDPIKYSLWRFGILDNENKSSKLILIKKIIGVTKCILNTSLNRDNTPIGEMGYAYSPLFFIKAANEIGMQVNIYNSFSYEYRFHVLLKK